MNLPQSVMTPQPHPRGILLISSFAHAVHDGYLSSIYVLLPFWAVGLNLSMTQVGSLTTAYYLAMAGLQLPMGVLAERIGERGPLALGTVILGIGFVLMGWSDGFVTLLVCLLVAGAASGVQHPLASSLVATAYSQGSYRAALGTYNFAGDIGKAAIPALVGLLISAFGWRASVVWVGALGVAAAAGLWLILLKLHSGGPHPAAAPAGDGDSRNSTADWGIRNRRGFSALAAIGVVGDTVRTAFFTFVPFLLIAKGAAAEIIGFAMAALFIGGAVGKLACGFLAERLGVIRMVVVTELASGATIIALLFLPLMPALVLLPLIGVTLNGTSSVLYATVADFVAPERHSRAFGLFYTLTLSASALAPLAYGVLSEAVGLPIVFVTLGVFSFATVPLCWPLTVSRAAKYPTPGGG